MNILFIADPSSIHDLKWISYFSENGGNNTFILPRSVHVNQSTGNAFIGDARLLVPINDFSIVRFYINIWTAYRLKSILKKYKIDIVHILYAEPNALWALFRSYFDVPMIISTRGTDVLKTIPEVFKRKSLINFFVGLSYKKAFRLADWVTGTSETQLKSIAKFSDRTTSMSLVRTGVNLHSIAIDTSIYFPKNIKKPFILFPRYIKPVYNHEFGLEAIDLMDSNFKKMYQMVFVGKDNGDMQYQNKIENLMKRMRGVDFIFLPQVSQNTIFELYKRASAVVMTPHSDGTPVSAMEAMACGANVILGPIQYDTEIFNTNVFRLSDWDAKELASLIAEVSTQGRKKYADNLFSLIDRVKEMKKMENIYSTLLS